MDQTSGGQNKNTPLSKRNQALLIAAAIVVIAGIIYAVNRNGEGNQSDQNTNQETTMQENGQDQEQKQNTVNNQQQPGNETGDVQGSAVGNVTASGTLRASDNLMRGNFMVNSNLGKIYVSTVRDFSGLLNQQVTLQAEGTINQFVFLGFAESKGAVAGADTAAKVSIVGRLDKSDNTAKGNYTVSSANTKVYLKTVHDYSAWVGSQVRLTANGTIDSFNNASLVKI